MDVITAANKESALLTSLESNQVSDVYTYRLMANLPNASRSIWTVSPNIPPSGTSHGKQCTFRLPRYGLLQRAVIKCDLVVAGDSTFADASNIGERVFSEIRLQSNSKVISTSRGAYNRVRCDNASSEVSHTLSMISQESATMSTATVTAYTPVHLPFFEKSSNYLDLEFVDQLDLQCDVNDASGMGLTQDLTSATFTLYLFFRNLSNEARRAYEAKNFSPEKPLNMLIYDQYEEVKACDANSTTTTITLNVPHAVFATHFFIRKGLTGSTTGQRDIGPVVPITTYSLSFTGKTILSAIPESVMKYDGSHYKISGDSVSRAGAIAKRATGATRPSPISLYWGESNDRTYNSHAVAMSNINNPQLVVNYAALGAGIPAELVVVHEYWKLATISSDDGRIDIGYSL